MLQIDSRSCYRNKTAKVQAGAGWNVTTYESVIQAICDGEYFLFRVLTSIVGRRARVSSNTAESTKIFYMVKKGE